MSDIKVMNFKRVEVVAKSKEEAKNKVIELFGSYQGDATPAYKKWREQQVNGVTDRDKKEFMLNYMATKGKNIPGSGFMICIDKAVADTRTRPYIIRNVKNTEGKRDKQKTLTWIDKETGQIVAKVQGTKAEAAKAIKELYKSGKYTGKTKCEIHYDIVKGNPVVMEAEYAPSVNAKVGTWIVFGLENA